MKFLLITIIIQLLVLVVLADDSVQNDHNLRQLGASGDDDDGPGNTTGGDDEPDDDFDDSSTFIPFSQCRPRYGTTEPECRDRIRRCLLTWHIKMKWTGPGSRDANGRAEGDGGCQCKEYCGYFTKGPCNRDPKCIWATAKGVCYHRHPNHPGFPIPQCYP